MQGLLPHGNIPPLLRLGLPDLPDDGSVPLPEVPGRLAEQSSGFGCPALVALCVSVAPDSARPVNTDILLILQLYRCNRSISVIASRMNVGHPKIDAQSLFTSVL